MNSTVPALSILKNWLGTDPNVKTEPKVVLTSTFVDVFSEDARNELETYMPRFNNKDAVYSSDNKDEFCFIQSSLHGDANDLHIKTQAIGDRWNNDMKNWMEKVEFKVEQDTTNGEYYLEGAIKDGGKFASGWQINRWTTHLDADGQMTEERFTWQKDDERVMSMLKWGLYKD